ncbi:alkaline phosphatase PhoX [Mesonia sp.]|uniref:alkaline phosphatase PhoX n=1 Tax=Mesonia sp. TaxID=1960830 RepID=UPI003F94A0CB
MKKKSILGLVALSVFSVGVQAKSFNDNCKELPQKELKNNSSVVLSNVETFINTGSLWSYNDTGLDLGSSWKDASYDDTSWATGNAILGYGDDVETTVLNYGPDTNNKYPTYYFRHEFQVTNAASYEDLVLNIMQDDGVVIYLNGTEVSRLNMPTGAITYNTYASSTVGGANEGEYTAINLANSLQDGINVIAVELHQATASSSDLRFDLSLIEEFISNFDCSNPHMGCFTSIVPTAQQSNMIIPQEHRFQLIFKQGDAYMDGSGTVPGNNDFTGYVPVNGSSELGYVAVNHENNPGGVSVLDVNFNDQTLLWEVSNTRPVDLYNSALVTTVRNCSGGTTPWGTVVTAEESTNGGDANSDGYEDVGWLVEIDPVTAEVIDYGNGQEKLWAMGRMKHENVVVSDDSATAYFGEDGGTDCVYKYVMDTPGDLSAGTLYVLVLDAPLSNNDPTSPTGQWLQVPNTTIAERNNVTSTAAALGGTNFNGVEDCEISPLDGKIYFAAKGKSRTYRFTDNGTTVSDFETFVGGTSYEISSTQGTYTESWGGGNDNLTFDDKGNLWVLQDGGNNYIWVVRPDHTQATPNVELFASMPVGSEPTGLTFTPDFKYGFFSIQHPSGSNTAQQDATFGNVTFDASATVVFALKENLGAQIPLSDFVADEVLVEEGDVVTYTDLTTNNPTAWEWTFEGGTPATSTDENPMVTYDLEGVYAVTLKTTNAAGNNEVIKTDYIVVEDELSVESNLKDIVSIYPNPTQGNLFVVINDLSGQAINVQVFDLLGRKVTQVNGMQTTGSQQEIRLDFSEFSSSEQLYIVEISIGNKTARYKVLKSN